MVGAETEMSIAPSVVVPILNRDQEELLLLRRLARASSSLLNAPYLEEHRLRVIALLNEWRAQGGS